MSSFIGPVLPLHLQRKEESGKNVETSKSSENEAEQETDSDAVIGPSLSTKINQRVNHPLPLLPSPTNKRNVQASEIHPLLPPHLLSEGMSTENDLESQKSHMMSILPLRREAGEGGDSEMPIRDANISDEESDRNVAQDEMYGPALPPGLRVGFSRSTKDGETELGLIGPRLPPAMKLSDSVDHGDCDSDTDVVGPMPAPSGTCNTTYRQEQLDDRALRMKRKLAEEDNPGSEPMKRENWMLELPPERAAEFGLGPRQFRVRTEPESGDRSVWTDTPADRLRKKLSPGDKPDALHELELRTITARDKEMQCLVEKYSGRRKQESLLEAHQKEMKKKRKKEKEEGKHEERRPFDRSVDLQTNRFDEAQKKVILKKAQLLNDRFSSGQRKFL